MLLIQMEPHSRHPKRDIKPRCLCRAIRLKPDLAKQIYAKLKDKDPKGPAGMLAAQKLNPAPTGPGGQ